MKIAMINGSPKLGESTSAFMLKLQESMLVGDYEITHYNINRKPLTQEQYIELCHVDTLIFAFPLYIDAIPSHLFRMMATLESYIKKERKKQISVYVIVNNGFYEGNQTQIAIEIMEHWCSRCGLHFGQGIGQGAGEMIGGFMQEVPIGQGPLKNLGRAMKSLADSIRIQGTREDILVSPNFPRFAWKFCSTHLFWHSKAKKNGLRIKDIKRKMGAF